MDWGNWVLGWLIVWFIVLSVKLRKATERLERQSIAVAAEVEVDQIFRDRDRDDLEEKYRNQADQIELLQVKMHDMERRLSLLETVDPVAKARADEIMQHFWSPRPEDKH